MIPILESGLKARNRLAHSVAISVDENLDSELEKRITDIRDLVAKIAEADKICAAIIHILNNDPLPSKVFYNTYEQRVCDWVCKDTFDE